MRLSESLRRNIMQTHVGGIINKFKVKSRRTTLFFEDILANYIKECENTGYENNMRDIGKKWSSLGVYELTPKLIKNLPPKIFFKIMKKVWTNLGILEDINFTKKGDYITLRVKNNTITRIIGKNNFEIGCFIGIMEVLFSSEIEFIPKIKDKHYFEEYHFKIKSKKNMFFECKNKEKYNKLNAFQNTCGLTLKDALKRKIITIKENRMFFRERSICNSENTLFHIISNEKIALEKIPKISHKYFKNIVEKETSSDKKITLLKNLLEIMGWGCFKIIKNKNNIVITIINPPYGLQVERDNWEFLIRTILGYLWLIQKDFKIKSVKTKTKKVIVIYERRDH